MVRDQDKKKAVPGEKSERRESQGRATTDPKQEKGSEQETGSVISARGVGGIGR